jgi:prepilin-type N-terminal cleavage/methylation domain-containing protein
MINTDSKRSPKRASRMSGLTLLELLVALAVILIIGSIAIPNLNTAMHSSRLKGAASDFASLLQVARIRSVDDDHFYSVYVLPANNNRPQEGFVDIYPLNANGTYGSNGQTINAQDPIIQVSTEVIPRPQGAAPNTAALRALILPANSPVVPKDGSAAGTPITFSPRGLPCSPVGGVCDTLGGPQAYWFFFQNTSSQNWAAVTVTPAGRIQRWLYSGGGPGGAIWVRY